MFHVKHEDCVVINCTYFVTIQHSRNYGNNQNGELAHQADFLHNFWLDKARSDSDHPQARSALRPEPGVLNSNHIFKIKIHNYSASGRTHSILSSLLSPAAAIQSKAALPISVNLEIN